MFTEAQKQTARKVERQMTQASKGYFRKHETSVAVMQKMPELTYDQSMALACEVAAEKQ